MLRPRVLERVRQQIATLNRPDEAAAIDVLLSQPRASEILMDKTIGSGRSVSAANIEDMIASIKKIAAEEIRVEYEERLKQQQMQTDRKVDETTRELIGKAQQEKERLEAERQARLTERETVSEKINALEGQLTKLINDQTKREIERKLEFDRILASAVKVAEAALRSKARTERFALMAVFIMFAPVFLVPAIFTSHWLAPVLGSIGAVISLVGTVFFAWNRPVNFINRYFERRARKAVHTELVRFQMEYLLPHMLLDYKTCSIHLAHRMDESQFLAGDSQPPQTTVLAVQT